MYESEEKDIFMTRKGRDFVSSGQSGELLSH